uniref:Secreted protein n=1 Tax=Panagrellus redivivus TaxID=6233 RepID=A0A7E4USN3_PANRE
MWAESKGNCSPSSSSNPIAGLFVVDDGIGIIKVVQDATALLVCGLSSFYPVRNCQTFNDANYQVCQKRSWQIHYRCLPIDIVRHSNSPHSYAIINAIL